MPLAPTTGRFLVGLHKQSAEGTVGTVSDYTTPLMTGDRPVPVQDTAVLAMTDGASITGDTFKLAGEHWEANFAHVAWDDMLGTELVGLWPTDTPSGTAPSRLHTFTGLGNTPPFMAVYADEFASGTLSETFGKGICSGIDFDFNASQRELRVTYHAVGQTPTVATFTSTVTEAVGNGFFLPLAPANGILKFDEDSGTPATHVNIVGGKVSIERPVTPVQTADGVAVGYLALGLVTATAHLDIVFETMDAYRSTFYGAAAGTAASSTFPSGSVDLTFGHSVSATSIFEIKLDKVAFLTTPPAPDPAASPLVVAVDLAVLKPASGDIVKPLLTNNVTAAY